MNNSCEFARGGGTCLCGACQSAREAMEEMEKVTPDEVEELFEEAEKLLDNLKKE